MRTLFFVCLTLVASARLSGETRTQVVMLGSGNPNADPERSGPAVAIVVNNRAYLVDCGPGVVRRAAAAEKNGIAALNVKKLNIVFITHLHSDHTLGYPDLIFTPWVLDREEPLQAYGPRGLKAMTGHIEKAWKKDIQVRRRGLEQANASQHFAVLRGKQIVVNRKEGNQVFYSLRDPVLIEVLDVLRRYFFSQLSQTMSMLKELRKG